MYIQNGEWVIILGVRNYFRKSIFKSLRFRLIILMFLAGMLPMIVLKAVILNSYEKRAVDVRTADIQNQCTILCNQLGDLYGQEGDTSDIVRTQLVQLSNIYNGRVMIIDHEFRIIEDTYGMDVGKTIVSGNVIRCFSGEGTSRYDAGNR